MHAVSTHRIYNISYMHIISLELTNLITRSSSPAPQTQLVKGVWDFKTWMNPHLADVVKYHSKPLAFRFTRTQSGDAEFHYKRFSDHPWEPAQEGLKLIMVNKTDYRGHREWCPQMCRGKHVWVLHCLRILAHPRCSSPA